MKTVFKKIRLLSTILLCAGAAHAQNIWPSPELSQMYHHAQEYMALGNYKEAITIYNQALLLDPDKFILCKELGKALYLSGKPEGAEKVLAHLTDRREVDDECYQLLAAAQVAQQSTKAARGTLNNGLAHFPASGLLYYESGKLYAHVKKQAAALGAWIDGIEKAPSYPQNYYEASIAYTAGDKVLWGLLYGEIYLNIAKDTTGSAKIKGMLFAAYKTMFDDIAESRKAKKQVTPFTEAVQDIYAALTPVVSDGITTENLTMVRTRFLMDWFAKYGRKYSFSLFSYQDYLLRNGLFDIYNEWLFGKAGNTAEYEAWNQFHPGEIALFLQNQKEHPLQPVTPDFYNGRDISEISKDKKEK